MASRPSSNSDSKEKETSMTDAARENLLKKAEQGVGYSQLSGEEQKLFNEWLKELGMPHE